MSIPVHSSTPLPVHPSHPYPISSLLHREQTSMRTLKNLSYHWSRDKTLSHVSRVKEYLAI